LGICCWMSSLPKMGSRYSQPCWHLNHSSKMSCQYATHKTSRSQDLGTIGWMPDTAPLAGTSGMIQHLMWTFI
jgi:hypothetical protein